MSITGTSSFLQQIRSIKDPEQRLAWAIAIVADALQIAAFPFFAEGGVSPADSLLDLLVGYSMIRLLGWHWAFLPTIAAELIPGADLFPTWTAAVWFVTRHRLSNDSGSDSVIGEPEILPPDPSSSRSTRN